MFNITEKTTKKQVLDFLSNSIKAGIKNANLKSRVSYTVKKATEDITQVEKKDLIDIAKELLSSLVPAPAPVEASPKPKLGAKKPDAPAAENKPADKPTDKSAAKSSDKPAADSKTTGKDKKPAPKPADKKADKPAEKPEVKTKDSVPQIIPLAKMFPKELDHEMGKLVAVHDQYKDIESLRAALEAGKTIVFACYWTKRHLKQFNYAETFQVNVPKDGFPFDLDIVQAIMVCEKMPRIYAMSAYTEAMCSFNATDLVPFEETDKDGNKYSLRVCNGMEFELYELQETPTK